jgi:hypothetical protein
VYFTYVYAGMQWCSDTVKMTKNKQERYFKKGRQDVSMSGATHLAGGAQACVSGQDLAVEITRRALKKGGREVVDSRQ